MTKELKIAYAEVLTIISHMEIKYKEMIPQKLLAHMEKNQEQGYNFKIDFSIPLKENTFSEKTLPLLAMINLNYWCETEQERQAQLAIHKANDKEYLEQQKDKYDLSKLVKKEEVVEVIEETDTQPFLWLEVPEDNWFERLLYKIKCFFKRKFRK